MIMQRIANHEIVEVPITAGATTFPFQNNFIDKLQGKYIVGVAINHISSVALSPTNFALLNDNAFKYGYLILQHKNMDRVTNLPFDTIMFSERTATAATRYGWTPLNYLQVDFYKSKITFPTNAGLVANEVAMFSFLYVNKVPKADLEKAELLNS